MKNEYCKRSQPFSRLSTLPGHDRVEAVGIARPLRLFLQEKRSPPSRGTKKTFCVYSGTHGVGAPERVGHSTLSSSFCVKKSRPSEEGEQKTFRSVLTWMHGVFPETSRHLFLFFTKKDAPPSRWTQKNASAVF